MGRLSHRKQNCNRGAVLPLLAILVAMFTAIMTLAIDYGHAQLTKTQMQRTADATARAYMQYYIIGGQTYANTHGPNIYASANNPIDANSGTSPTISVTWGFWTPASSTFSTSSGTYPAVKVVIKRTNSGSNALAVTWGGMMGLKSVDLTATAIAVQMGGQSGSLSIPPTASLYLAGMSAGSSTLDGDDTTNATPYGVTSIPVTPGTWISFPSLTGTSTVSPGAMPYVGPGGNTSYPVHHGESWNNVPDNAFAENGIADALIYEDAVTGLFLTNSSPNLASAPAFVDWTNASLQNQATYTNLKVQQPFMIGDGKTSGGTVQQFMVPPGATRLFIGIWDGYIYNNNSTTPMGGTVTANYYVQLVQ